MTPPDRRAVEARLALIYGAIFFVFGVQLPFLPVWLSARGLSIGEIGLALAVPRLLQVVLVPALSRWADRRGGVVAMLALSCLTMALLFAALAATTRADADPRRARPVVLRAERRPAAGRRARLRDFRPRRPPGARAARRRSITAACGCGARSRSSPAISSPASF